MFDRYTGHRDKPVLDDEELQQTILDKLEDDPAFQATGGRRTTRVTVEVDDGEVTLRGVVRSAMDRRKADIVARALGAATVDNQLRIEEAGQARAPRRRAS